MLKKCIMLLLGIFFFIGVPFFSNITEVNSIDLGIYATIRTATFSKVQYCALSDIARQHGLKITNKNLNAYISGKGISFRFTINKKYGAYNSLNISYLFPVAKTKSGFYISTQDYRNVILPLIQRANLRSHAIKTICIDPGHGGVDSGAKGRKYLEKNIALAVAKKVGALLQQRGYRVIYTRNRDTTLTLDQRSSIANKYGANLFISLHCNAAKNKSISGIESFCMTPAGAASTYDTKPRLTRYNGNSYDRNNFRLCHEIHRSLIANMKPIDRGIKHARFAVLRGVKCPGVLIEMGFISNIREEANMGSVIYQDKLAKNITNGIIRYHTAIKK